MCTNNRRPNKKGHSYSSVVSDQQIAGLRNKQSSEDYEFRDGFNPNSYKTEEERYEAEERYRLWKNKGGSEGGSSNSGGSKTFSVNSGSGDAPAKSTGTDTTKSNNDTVTKYLEDGKKVRMKKKSDGRSGTVRTSSQGVTDDADTSYYSLLGG